MPENPRQHLLVDRAPRKGERYVLYWMTATRRLVYNHALDRALELARELRRPLLVLEPLRCDYPWASDRLHAFVLQGMAEHAERLEGSPVGYWPYVEPSPGAGKGLLAALAAESCAVVTDQSPTFFTPRLLEAATSRLDVRLEAIDSCGLLPLAATDRPYARAVDFRRMLQKELPAHLDDSPQADPLEDVRDLVPFESMPPGVAARWPQATDSQLEASPAALARLPIDHEVPPVPLRGGTSAARELLEAFCEHHLEGYGEDRNDPDSEATSFLSPYLHFGHLSTHEILDVLAVRHDWSPRDVAGPMRGAREGWWGLPPGPEAWLDQVVTWRELGYHFCHHRPDHDSYESLPRWALETLSQHRGDRRPHLYDPEAFEHARTHDELWNAAQRQLRRDGRIHNYLRMLWGKKILEWTEDPAHALEVMVHLNNRYALDGRDPNSYSGIFWVLGRFDRAWGPEREIFGKVRFMSSDNTRRKLRVTEYLRRHGA